MSKSFNALVESYMSTLDTEYIESFRQLVNNSIESELDKVEKRLSDHKQKKYDDPDVEYLNFEMINDEGVFFTELLSLGSELSIISLYKLFERKHTELICMFVEGASKQNCSNWEYVEKQLPLEAKALDSYMAANELRLINNSIKHGGVVSGHLAKYFPYYGVKGNELPDLEPIYTRLKADVISYIRELYNIFKKQGSEHNEDTVSEEWN